MWQARKTFTLIGATLCAISLSTPLAYASTQPADSRDATCITAVEAFKDVSMRTPHVNDINWLVCQGITTGYPNGSFQGMTPVYRQDMAAFLRRYAKTKGYADADTWKPAASDWKRFKDVSPLTPHAEDILWLAHANISEGWSERDGSRTFRGMTPVLRQDMAAFLRRLAVDIDPSKDDIEASQNFSDVNSATPHSADILWLAEMGISNGYANKDGSRRFEGVTRVYRQDMAAFLHRSETSLDCTKSIPAKTHEERQLVAPEHTEERVIEPEHTEVHVIESERTERRLISEERVIEHPAVTHEEPIYEERWTDVYVFPDGYVVSGRGPSDDEFMDHGDPTITMQWQQVQVDTRTVVDKEAWTETIPAKYETVIIPAITETVTIPAKTETVTIPAEYKTVTVVDEPAHIGSCDVN